MELVESHLVLEKGPAELRLVVDVRDLRDLLRLCASSIGVELLRDRRGVVLELLEKRGCDGQEIDTSESLDLSRLPSK